MNEKFENKFMGFINKYSKLIMIVLVIVIFLLVTGFSALYYFGVLKLSVTPTASSGPTSSAVYTKPSTEDIAKALKTKSTSGTVTAITSRTVSVDKLLLNVTADSQITSGTNAAITPLSSLVVGKLVTAAYDDNTKNLVNIYWEN